MDSNVIFGAATIIALIFAVYQTIHAKKSDKKLEETKSSLKELEEGMVLSSFKLRKAVEFYNDGHYKNSLEAFKKYTNESEDYTELRNAIETIFWKESKKIYADCLGKNYSLSILVIITLTRKIEGGAKYPEYVNSLLDIYQTASGSPLPTFLIPVLLNQEKYNEALRYMPERECDDNKNDFSNDFECFIKKHISGKTKT